MELDSGGDRLEERFSHIPWHEIRGFGNRLRHEYGRIESDSIWKTIAGSDLPQLRAAMEAFLRDVDT